MTDHFELSIMIGTRAMSGSDPTRFRKCVIEVSPSRSASSKFTSMMSAPASTCWRAMERAASKSPFKINFLNFGEPVTLVRSPTNRKPLSLVAFKGSRPAYLPKAEILPGFLGGTFWTFETICLICSGVVPQHPPIMFIQPCSAKSFRKLANSSGVWSYSPIAFGNPALG